jgi:polyphosphate kinase 2 (PPK2 family)
VKVHPELVEAQKLPDGKRGKSFWQQRYEDINAFERHLVQNGIIVLKFFLNVSKATQKRRFLERLERPEKNWKFSPADIAERSYWDQYIEAFEDALTETSTEWAPWYVVPADYKWATHLIVAEVLTSTIKGLDLNYPKMTEQQLKTLQEARRKLESEKDD